MNITAVVLCGGQGTRLRPVIGDLPKCLAPVAGKPFIEYILNHLQRQEVRNVVLCTGFNGERVWDAVRNHYRGMAIRYSHQVLPTGTGEALRAALPMIDEWPALVLNGDTYCNFDLKTLESKYYDMGMEVLTLCTPTGVSTGVSIVSKTFIEEMEMPYSLEKNLEWATNAGERFFVQECKAFLDIGTPEGYAEAESFLREQGAIK